MKKSTAKLLSSSLVSYAKDIPTDVDILPFIHNQLNVEKGGKEEIRDIVRREPPGRSKILESKFSFARVALSFALVVVLALFSFSLLTITQKKNVFIPIKTTQTFAAVPFYTPSVRSSVSPPPDTAASAALTPATSKTPLLFLTPGTKNPLPIYLNPLSYTTISGYDGHQPVKALSVQDQSGAENNWDKYIEFKPRDTFYAGYRTYSLPNDLDPRLITRLEVKANYEGLAQPEQIWTWQIYNWRSGKGDKLGSNDSVSDWVWSSVTFNVTGNLLDYIGPHKEVRLLLVSNNNVDSLDLDYEALIVYL